MSKISALKLKSLKFSKNRVICVDSFLLLPIIRPHRDGRLAQLGEHRPYKAGVTGSSPVSSTTSVFRSDYTSLSYHKIGRLAQLGEHRPYKAGVTGSSPVSSTTLCLHKQMYKV